MKTQRKADIQSGIFLAVLGLVILGAATQITGGLEERLPPRTLPYTMGFFVFFGGLLLALKSWRFKGEDTPISWPDKTGTRHVIVTARDPRHLSGPDRAHRHAHSDYALHSFSVWYLRKGRRRVFWAAATGLISGAVVFFLFMQFLELSFPAGILQP